MPTETLNPGNFFGEEEIMAETNRKHNAKCLSQTVVVLMVSLERLEKLMVYPEFRRDM